MSRCFDCDDLFRYVVHVLQNRCVVFDFYRLAGGPYGYALPASVTLTLDGQVVSSETTYSGYPQIHRTFPRDQTEINVKQFLCLPDFVRLSYLDVTGFKVLIARADQLIREK